MVTIPFAPEFYMFFYMCDTWFLRNNCYITLPLIRKFHQEHVMNGTVELHFVPSEEQTADIFTKALDESTFTRLVGKLGMLNSFFK